MVTKSSLIVVLIILFLLILIYIVPFFPEIEKINPALMPSQIVMSPAFGTIDHVKYISGIGKGDMPVDVVVISIYLSLLDTHVQYYPMSGYLIHQYKEKGKNEFATDRGVAIYNNSSKTVMQSLNNKVIHIYRYTGYFSRRLVSCKDDMPYISDRDPTFAALPRAKVITHQNVTVGKPMGAILLGSRVEIMIPAKNFELSIMKGEKVYGPNTMLGIYR